MESLLYSHLNSVCPQVHSTRLQAVMDVSVGIQKSKSLNLTAIGRQLASESELKHRVKKVDRLLGNKHLYEELEDFYKGLSSYTMKYVVSSEQLPIIVDLCFLKDSQDVQMLSAEVALKGRSLPIYRDIFGPNELKNRAASFVSKLSNCLPEKSNVLLIMDAGFGDDWFKAVEDEGWFWLVRARGKKFLKLSEKHDWADARDLFGTATSRAKQYPNAHITKLKPRPCRVVIKGQVKPNGARKKPKKLPREYNAGCGNYSRTNKEPWVLVTNLPSSCTTTQVVNYYKKRMQIEESFRDLKSTQFGLGARNIRTTSIYRWAILLLLAAIVQVTVWIIGVIGHHSGLQKYFQHNTVKDRKVFSYFFLGQLIADHNKLDVITPHLNNLESIIHEELQKAW